VSADRRWRWASLLRRARPQRSKADPRMLSGMTMTRDELTAWAAMNGKVVVDKAEHEDVCATAAADIAAQADLDCDFAALFGPHT